MLPMSLEDLAEGWSCRAFESSFSLQLVWGEFALYLIYPGYFIGIPSADNKVFDPCDMELMLSFRYCALLV